PHSCFSYSYRDLRFLHSFPTRRSSDLHLDFPWRGDAWISVAANASYIAIGSRTVKHGGRVFADPWTERTPLRVVPAANIPPSPPLRLMPPPCRLMSSS